MTRETLHRLLSPAYSGDESSRAVDLFIIGLILIDLCAFVLESVPEFNAAAPDLFLTIESLVLWIFVVEYFLRLYACTAEPKYRHPVAGRLRYARSVYAVIDLLAILPVLALVPGPITAVRGFRLLRLVKIARYAHSVRILGRAVVRIRHELSVIAFVVVLVLVTGSTLLYTVEKTEQAEAFASIPKAMWYAVVVMTTLGLGDVTVVTTAGKMISGCLAIVGIAMFAMPAGLLGAAFVEQFRQMRGHKPAQEKGEEVFCPECNKWFVPLHRR